MKRSHIILIIMLFVAIAVIVATIHDSSTYADFSQARKDPGKTFQVIGKLDKTKEIIYDSTLEKLFLSFYMKDSKNEECKVVYFGTKPNDFIKLQEVVVTGKMENDVFVAREMLLKCPSKYTNSEGEFSRFSSKK